MSEQVSRNYSGTKCPLCLDYGVESILERLEDGDRVYYRCSHSSLRHNFCEHILIATKKDTANFSCENCPDSIDYCNCDDCFVFCDKCNAFLYISCSDVISVINRNEETKEAKS